MMTEPTQEVFRSVYRERNSVWHRCSYMRLGKTYAIHAALADVQFNIAGKRVFDFGFGPGNFLTSCPLDCHLFGCEIDSEHVKSLAQTFENRGQASVDLRHASDESSDYAAAFHNEKYDVIVLSHVLEHIKNPEEVLIAVRDALTDDGVVVVVLPINEQKPDPKHYHAVDSGLAKSWFEKASMSVDLCRELGCVNYLIQPYHGGEGRVGRFIAQSASLAVGLMSRVFSPSAWWSITDRLGTKRGQVVLVGKVPKTGEKS